MDELARTYVMTNGYRLASGAVVILLASFYAYVTYLAFHPDVSPLYRMYYIDKKLLFWSRGVGLGYRCGQPLSFHVKLPYLSAFGWARPEPWGSWSDGPRSQMYFQMDAGDHPADIYIQGHPLLSPTDGVTRQRVRAFFNDVFLGETKLVEAGQATLHFQVPPEAVRSDDSLSILRFEYPDAVSPRSLGQSDDERNLGFAFETLVIQPRSGT